MQIYYWLFAILLIIVIIILVYFIQNRKYCNKPFLSNIISYGKMSILTTPNQQMFNPSCFVWKNEIYIAYRHSPYTFCKHILHTGQLVKNSVRTRNYIVIQKPDKSIVKVQYIKSDKYKNCAEQYEDPRPVIYADKLILVVNDPQQIKCKNKMVLLILSLQSLEKNISQIIPEAVIPLVYPSNRIEKNWMPFVYLDDFYFIYQINPHLILKCDIHTGICIKVAETRNSLITKGLRGGTPVKRLNIDYYITFGHVKKKIFGMKQIYTTIAYLFEAKPPFSIVKVSKEFFIDNDFEKYKFKNIIQFASGLEIFNGKIYLTFGHNDCTSKMLTISVANVLQLF
jgi:predicted GH43/DUF377 family glycosyl hydrolase